MTQQIKEEKPKMLFGYPIIEVEDFEPKLKDGDISFTKFGEKPKGFQIPFEEKDEPTSD